jgi:hypothetical protein
MIEELVKRFAQVGESSIAARDWETYGSVFAEDLLMVTPAIPGTTRGRHTRIQFVQGIVDSFPDGVVEVQRCFGKGLRRGALYRHSHRADARARRHGNPAYQQGSQVALLHGDEIQRRAGQRTLRVL